MALTIVPIGDILATTIQGVSDYWVRLPVGSKPIRSIFTGAAPGVTAGYGVYMVAKEADTTIVVHSCDAAFAEDVPAGCTVAVDTLDYKVGTGCNKFTFTAAAAAGIIVCATVADTLNTLLTATHVEFWIKCSVNTVAANLQLLLDDTAKCVSPLETLSVPALTANVWSHVRVALANPSILAKVISVGLKYTVDIGACDIWIDDIRAVKSFKQALTSLKVDQFIIDDVYFALSDAIQGGASSDRMLVVQYFGPDEDPQCSN